MGHHDTTRHVALWRQLDRAGMEHCRLTGDELAFSFDGAVVTMDLDVPWRVDYGIVCDTDWRTCVVSVTAVSGTSDRTLNLSAGEGGRWRVNGAARPDLDGCLDVDLGFSPSTNTLPIRRLAPGLGESVTIDAAWVEFPSLEVRRAPQRYTRTGARVYRFEHLATEFVADIEVDDAGLVVAYPQGWERVGAPATARP
jgi:uncharacterized protein